MTLPSFDEPWSGSGPLRPRVVILEVGDRLGQTERPVAFIAVERTEQLVHNNEDDVVRGSLILDYQVIDLHSDTEREGGAFAASYCAVANSISLTSSNHTRGAVFLDPEYLQGQRVGTYLMNEIVCWARQWPEAMVNSIHLSEAQASPDNTARRNRFYEQFGLQFVYDDPNQHAGRSMSLPAGRLVPCFTWQLNIKVWRVDDFLGHLLSANRDLKLNQEILRKSLRDLWQEVGRAEASPWVWATKTWAGRNVPLLIALTLIFTLVSSFFIRY